MRIVGLIVIAVLGFAAVSCNKKTAVAMAPMGESAPTFGTGENAALQTFAVGRWCVIEGMGGLNKARYFEFKPDGTFETGVVGGDYTSTGKWAVQQNVISLAYETMKGKPYEAYRAEYKKDEEGGGQVAVSRALFYDGLYSELDQMRNLWVDEDGKHLTFSQPQPPNQNPDGELGDMMESLSKSGGFALERMAAEKAG